MNNKPNPSGNRSIQLTIAFDEADIVGSLTTSADVTALAKHGTGTAETPVAEPPAKPEKAAVAGTPGSAREALQPIGHRERKRKWYSLWDKVYALPNLQMAWEKVQSNGGAAGLDGLTIEMFARRADARLQALSNDLKTKKYRPQPVRRVYIPKADGGKRPLGIPSIQDRIVQQALLQILSPLFETRFSPRSHGFRPERGCHTCLTVVDRAVRHGYTWVVDADIKGFFDHVDHEILLKALNEEIADGSVLNLIEAILKAGVIEPDVTEFEPSELGTPQGGPLSPLLANIYLDRLDQAMGGKKYGLVRYADDFVIFAHSQSEAEQALVDAKAVLEGELKLQLHPEKTRIVTVDSGFDFLGFHYFRTNKGTLLKRVRHKSAQKLRDSVRQLTPRIKNQKKPKPRNFTLRRLASNQRLRTMITKTNRFLRSWYAYFGQAWLPHETAFGWEDAAVRRRLRQALTGRVGNGWWNVIITNDWLHQLGLISLHELYLKDHPRPSRNLANREV